MNLAPSPFSPGASVAAYLRDSGGDTQDLSIAQQSEQIRTWCKENNLHLSQIFTDEAMPGSSVVGRAGFLSMISHFSNHASEAGVVVWKFSRFSREIDDAQFYKADLRRRGYVIHSINENIPAGLDGRLFEAALDWMNARFLKDLSEDVKRGLAHNIFNYGAIGGTPPRGFCRSEPITLGTRRDGKPHIVHRWEPDPELLPLVQLAFRMRASGSKLSEITRETRLYSIKSSWSHFFSNEIYVGVMNYGGQRIENYCEPMIDRKTWEDVQMVNLNPLNAPEYNLREHPRTKASDYILTGLLRCTNCGSPMTGHTIYNRRKNHTNRYYICTLKKRSWGKDCDAVLIPKDLLELTILDEITQHIINLDNLLKIHHGIASNSDREVSETRARLDQLHRARTLLHVQIDRLTDAITEYGPSPAIMEKIRTKEAEEIQTAGEIRKTEEHLSRITNMPGDLEIQNLAERLRPLFTSTDRPTLKRWLIQLVDHIEAERLKQKLTGVIFYFTPDEVMSKAQSHRSGYVHRHKFTV